MGLTIKKTTLTTWTVLLASVMLSALFESFVVDAVMATIILAMMIHQVNPRSGIHVMFLVGFSVFIYFPAFMNGLFLGTSYALFYASAAISFIFLHFATGMEYQPPAKAHGRYFVYLFFAWLAVIGASLAGDLALYFLSPFVMFYAICLQPGRTIRNILLFIAFISTFVFYYVIGWGGYGRTVTFGILIVGIVYFLYAQGIKVNRVAFSVGPIAGSLLLTSRKAIDDVSFNLTAAMDDSAIQPYRLADTFFEAYAQQGINISGFFDQILFTLFAWVPRGVWPDKPFAFGFQYVLDNLDPSLADEGHSIASTLIGDHIFYLGWWGLLTGAVMAYLVAKLCRLVYSMKLFNGFGVVIIACSMMVLVWGGMTSFAARMAFPVVSLSPFLLLYFASRMTIERPQPRRIQS